MNNYISYLKQNFTKALSHCYQNEVNENAILINETRKEFEGDYTFVLFPFVKSIGRSPEQIGNEIGVFLLSNDQTFIKFNVVKGFLNVTLSDRFWTDQLFQLINQENYGYSKSNHKKVMVEFSSPNTNKPLHLGHIRNILLGWSCSKILEANGYEVIKTQVINDRGIAICKSMLAWQKYGNGATPASTQTKSDHFVGNYYVLFEAKFKEEYFGWQSTDTACKVVYERNKKEGQSTDDFFKEYKNQYFNKYSALGNEARELLLKWEAKETDTIALWTKMNQWVYEGFEVTYDKLGVDFDTVYYESDTYLLGKKAVDSGIKKGVFYREADGSVWIDLEDVGMDKKIVLRSDGTSVYITQDIGTAQVRYENFGVDKMIYTVADEQDYHFKVLFEILKRLGEPYADQLYHLSYGMVELPEGKMKSREGTVVDADDLIAEVINEATAMSSDRPELSELSDGEKQVILSKIGLAALKFFMIKVQPKKRMIFDPKESVDMQGQTGPYIQNAYVRVKSVLRKAHQLGIDLSSFGNKQPINFSKIHFLEPEKALLKHLLSFPEIVKEAGDQMDPSSIANFSFALAKDFHRFYHEVRILGTEDEQEKFVRLLLSACVGDTLRKSFDLLGIEMVDKM